MSNACKPLMISFGLFLRSCLSTMETLVSIALSCHKSLTCQELKKGNCNPVFQQQLGVLFLNVVIVTALKVNGKRHLESCCTALHMSKQKQLKFYGRCCCRQCLLVSTLARCRACISNLLSGCYWMMMICLCHGRSLKRRHIAPFAWMLTGSRCHDFVQSSKNDIHIVSEHRCTIERGDPVAGESQKWIPNQHVMISAALSFAQQNKCYGFF